MATAYSQLLPTIVGANLGETAVDARYRWDNARPDAGPAQIFQWTRSGCGFFEAEGKVIQVPPDHAMVVTTPERSRYFHGGAGHPPWVFHWLTIEGAGAAWQEIRERFGTVVPLAPGTVAAGLLEEIGRMHLRHEFTDRYQVAEFLFRFVVALMRELERGSVASAGPVEQGRALIDQLFARPITIKEIAARVGLSREHFIREYTARVGGSPGARLRDLRLEHARRLLLSTTCTCAEAARQSGFSSAVHFARAFRARYGVTPTQSRA